MPGGGETKSDKEGESPQRSSPTSLTNQVHQRGEETVPSHTQFSKREGKEYTDNEIQLHQRS